MSTCTTTLYAIVFVKTAATDAQNGASKETAYVQFKDLRSAQMAVDAMNGFELAGRNSESLKRC